MRGLSSGERPRVELRAARGGRALLSGVLLVVLASACGEDHARRVHPELVPPPAPMAFGVAPVLNERKLAVPLSNVGLAALTVFSMRVKEEGAPFRVGDVPPEVARGTAESVDVFFKPSAERTFEATLLLETDDPDRPVLELPLLGEGRTRAVMELTPRALCGEKDSEHFGRTPEGGATVRTLTLRSLGSADLVVEEVAFTEGTSPAFSFIGSTRTPAVVRTQGADGKPGQLQLTVKYTVQAGAPDQARGGVRLRTSDPDQPEVVVPLCGEVNRAPVPVIAPMANASPGELVVFDGSGSTDPDGNLPLRYQWRLVRAPAGARPTPGATDGATFQLQLDPVLSGEYEVELSVTDSDPVQPATSVRPARAVVLATPALALKAELFWDNADTDVDLHLLRTPQTPLKHPTDDCFYENCRLAPALDWGQPGVTEDNPLLLRDWLRGYGPEVVGIIEPASGHYRVTVFFQNTHGAQDPTSEATVRVYVRGVLGGEYRLTLKRQDDRWPVVDVDWPSGNLTVLPAPQN